MIWEGNKKLAEKMRVMSILKNEGVINMTVSNVLSNLSKTWKTVEPIAASFSNIPDGDYTGDLKELKLGTAKKGRTQVVVDWEVADGELAGKTQKQFYGLSDDKGIADATGMGYWKNVCEVIGLDLPEDLNLWQAAMDEFVGNSVALYDITAKANGQYTNVYVNGISDYTKGTGEEQVVEEQAGEEVVAEEVVEEELEVVEEVPEQEVVVPTRKALAKPVVTRPVAKVAAQPAKKPVTVAQPVRKIVSLNRK